jgi:hypothetical protein
MPCGSDVVGVGGERVIRTPPPGSRRGTHSPLGGALVNESGQIASP